MLEKQNKSGAKILPYVTNPNEKEKLGARTLPYVTSPNDHSTATADVKPYIVRDQEEIINFIMKTENLSREEAEKRLKMLQRELDKKNEQDSQAGPNFE